MDCGIKLYVLVENMNGIKSLDDVQKWQNPRYIKWCKFNQLHKMGKALSVKIPTRPPVNGDRLHKAMKTMQEKYGVTFDFCKPDEAGQRVLDLLTKDEVL